MTSWDATLDRLDEEVEGLLALAADPEPAPLPTRPIPRPATPLPAALRARAIEVQGRLDAALAALAARRDQVARTLAVIGTREAAPVARYLDTAL